MSAKIRCWLAIAAWLLAPLTLCGQHWAFQHYGVESGLTNPTILALYQDDEGFLWVNTEGGLFRFDGDQFQLFEAKLPRKTGVIGSLHQSKYHQLWAGSTAGLFRFTHSRFVPVPGTQDFELDNTEVIASDATNLYAAATSGLWSVPMGGSGQPKQLTEAAVASVFVSRDQTLWFGCGTGLCSWRDGRKSEWAKDRGVPMGPWHSITEDSGGRLWIRSADAVLKQDTPGGNFHLVANVATTHRALLKTARNGEILIPHSAGLTICNSKDCRNYGTESGLEHSEVIAVAEDREGSLWLGYSGHSLARWLGREEWQSFAEGEGLADTQIWRIAMDPSGTLWVGTNHGLFRGSEQNGHWRFKPSNVLQQWTVYGMLADPDGSLWLGTFQAGLNGLVHYFPKTGQMVVYPPLKPEPHFAIEGIARDDNGAIWVLSPKGLLRLQPGESHLEPVNAPVAGSRLYHILSARGAMYVGGRKGLYVERGSLHRLLTRADGLKEDAVQSVAVGPAGEVWINYYAGIGLTRLDWIGDHFRLQHFSASEGLPSNLIYSQYFDSRGQHWMGTDRGVAVFQKDHWILYDTSNGLVSDDCNASALFGEPNGTIWVGTSSGLSRFSPAARPTPPVPSALVTAVLRNDVATDERVFDSGAKTLALRFTMLSYLQQNPIFRYRLKRNAAWIRTRAHEVHFAELPPGQFSFEVQGEIGAGRWSRPAVREFTIEPAWFRSWPFVSGAVSLCVAAILVAWRRREVNERKLRAELEHAVEERTRGLAAATARAEHESRVKGLFLANMSHEMRTPLNGMLGLTRLALELSDQPEVIAHLKTAQFSAKLLLSLINDILDLAKIEAGMLEIVPETFSPRALVEEVCAMLKAEVQSKNLLLEMSVDPSVPAWVRADDTRLRQVFVNLIGNAIKFTARGRVSVSLGYDGERLQSMVTDTGIGVAEEQQSAIFDIFQQADSSTSRQHGGTGLGLSISRKLVESMGGSIRLKSQLGLGSTFSFDVAAPASTPPAVVQVATPEAPVCSMRVLVAEDNKVNQYLLLSLLRKRGHCAAVAQDGREALALYAREPFDLILMDIQMPGMDGLEAVRLIRQAEARGERRTPVVAVTARAMPGDREEILAAGMDSYLDKPIQNEQLDAILARFAPRVAGGNAERKASEVDERLPEVVHT